MKQNNELRLKQTKQATVWYNGMSDRNLYLLVNLILIVTNQFGFMEVWIVKCRYIYTNLDMLCHQKKQKLYTVNVIRLGECWVSVEFFVVDFFFYLNKKTNKMKICIRMEWNNNEFHVLNMEYTKYSIKISYEKKKRFLSRK